MINENFARQAMVSKNISDKTSRAEGHMQPSKIEEKMVKCLATFNATIKYQKNWRADFANISLIFKNTLVSKNDIGNLMKTYAEEEGITSQPRKKLISCLTLHNGTLISLLLVFSP